MRRGGGLYGNFVSASDNVQNKAYRGAEIPPPENLNSGSVKNNRVVGGQTPTPGLSKHGYSTINSIADSSMSYSQYGMSIKRGRTEEEYFNSASDEEKEKVEDDDGGYQPAPGSPGPGDGGEDEEEDPLDAFMADLEQEAVRTGEVSGLLCLGNNDPCQVCPTLALNRRLRPPPPPLYHQQQPAAGYSRRG